MAAKTHSTFATSKEKLMDDLQMVVADAEALLQATASQAGESAVAARARIQKNLHIVKERMLDTEEAMIERSKEAVKMTDEYVHDNPWNAIGVSAALGLIAGMLIARR
jgi:ElaB/YqjD/DUF883 family membrane-anchored ribosome-binding protein